MKSPDITTIEMIARKIQDLSFIIIRHDASKYILQKPVQYLHKFIDLNIYYGPVAQLVERRVCNAEAMGSKQPFQAGLDRRSAPQRLTKLPSGPFNLKSRIFAF